MRRLVVMVLALGSVFALVGAAAQARVLRVGSYRGEKGQYSSIQAAVDAAKPGDWILIGPGDYKTSPSSIRTPKGGSDFPTGVLITKRDLHIRGMNRNKVIVDGTKPGSAVCSRRPSAQNFGLRAGAKSSSYAVIAKSRRRSGVNGVMVYKAGNVSIQNLTVCNFLGGARDAGNGIWFNGGANSGKVGGHGYYGSYLTATSTYFKREATAATYGIFSSNWSGGTWDQTYASNFNDAGYYIGACQQVCDQTMNHAWAQFNSLGYSGSNSGGRLVIENSQFDLNQDGFDTNSQNGDEPSPQNGACPHNGISPITHSHSCWVFMHNYVHDNNNPNVPSSGGAAAGPTGTGMSLSGARNDTVMDNRFVHNGAWGAIIVSYPDKGKPCTGGTLNSPVFGKHSCLFEAWGNALLDNQFSGDGFFGNPSNGDFAEGNLEAGHPVDCYSANTAVGGGPLTPDAAALQSSHQTCNGSPAPIAVNPESFLDQVLCDTRVLVKACTSKHGYPLETKIVMHPLPKHLKSMPNPCAGVPSNPWCRRS